MGDRRSNVTALVNLVLKRQVNMNSLSNCAPEGSKLIPLSQGKFAIVDEADFEFLSQWKWCYWKVKNKDIGYAARIDLSGGGRKKVSMHRLVCLRHGKIESLEDCRDVDHANGDPLDNRSLNLRPASRRQNAGNRGVNKGNQSGYKGVDLSDPIRMVWRAQIVNNGKKRCLGYYTTPEGAALAYNEAARSIWGEFAFQNTVEGETQCQRLVYRRSKEYTYKGINFHKRIGKWQAYTKQGDRRIHIGYFKTEQEAIDARRAFIEANSKEA